MFARRHRTSQAKPRARQCPSTRYWLPLLGGWAVFATFCLAAASASQAADYSPGVVVVKYTARGGAAHAASVLTGAAASSVESASSPSVVHLPRGESVPRALQRLRRQSNIAWAVPDFRAHIAGQLVPNDRG